MDARIACGGVFRITFAAAAAAMLASAGCERSGSAEAPGQRTAVAASNSLLECAARELLGDGATLVRLAEPGTCPMHAELRPSQIRQLRTCRVLLRMDFQKSLDEKLDPARSEGLRVAEIRIPGGLCQPESYLQACRQSAEALVAAGLLKRKAADNKLAAVSDRMEALSRDCRDRVSTLAGTPVLASVHQKAFCQWLGLRVAGTFRGADVETPTRQQEAYDAARQAGAKLVVANLPEGRRAADFLAERLEGRVVVFGNFPALGDGQDRFDDLVRANVAALLKATGR